jgi:hypothetical protein
LDRFVYGEDDDGSIANSTDLRDVNALRCGLLLLPFVFAVDVSFVLSLLLLLLYNKIDGNDGDDNVGRFVVTVVVVVVVVGIVDDDPTAAAAAAVVD